MSKVEELLDTAGTGKVQKATLRRLDWRFLLPTPPEGGFRHLLLGGGPSELADRLLETGWAKAVSSELMESSPVDAAILLHDSPITLPEAAASLENGGVFYQEIKRDPLFAFRTRPSLLRRRLQEVGLTPTGIYWAAPNFEECRRYIPLDVAGAIQWYFSSLFVAGTPTHQLIRKLVHFAVGTHSDRLGWFVPTLSITGVASTSAQPPSLLNNNHIRALLPMDGLRPLLLTSGQDDASRLIMLPFAPHDSEQPQAVIKIATAQAFNGETQREQGVLLALHDTLDTEMSMGVPQALGTFTAGELAVAVESCAPGQSLWASSGGWGSSPQSKISDLEVGANWLTEFHRQTEVIPLFWDRHAIKQWIKGPLDEYQMRRGLSAAEERLFTLMHDHANTLIGAELPLVWQHNDFAPWNLFRSGERLTVIDWEFNRTWEQTRAGPVLCDLFYFVTYWNNVAKRLHTDDAEFAGARALFLGAATDDPYVEAVRRAITDYVTTLQIDWRFAPLLLVHTWVERVVYSYARAQKLTGEVAHRRAADKFAGYVSAFADHADELFCLDKRGFWQDAYFAKAIEDLG